MSEELISMAREDVDAFNAGDWDRMRSHLSADSVYEETATGRRLTGPDAIVEANQGWKAAFPDATGKITGSFACGDRAVIEVTWEGTQSGALQLPGGASLPASNRRVTVPACQVLRFADGKIVENRHFFDMLGMLEQMGTVSEQQLAHA